MVLPAVAEVVTGVQRHRMPAQRRAELGDRHVEVGRQERAEHEEIETRNWLPPGEVTVGITAGASCPNNLIEDAIRRLFELRGISVQQLLAG